MRNRINGGRPNKTDWNTHRTDQGAKLSANKNRTTKRREPEDKAVTQANGVFVKQVVFLTVNHRGPLPLRELHSTGETRVWRDPGGSWACLPPVYDYQWNHPATGCDTCRLRPKKHREKKRVIRNARKNKTTQTKSFVEEGVQEDWRRNTQNRRRSHTKY